MSSVSSFVCLSSNNDDIDDWSQSQSSNFSFIQTDHDQQLPFAPSEPKDDFDHLSQDNITSQSTHDMEYLMIHNNQSDRDELEHNVTTDATEWLLHDAQFAIESIATTPSIHSVDSVQNFVFSPYNFAKRCNPNANQSVSEWVWTRNSNRKRRKLKQRRRHRMQTSLCIIDENGEIETEQTPKVLNVANLNDFIDESIKINDNIEDIIRLCNRISKYGTLKTQTMDIELHKIPLIGLKLRDIFFRKLILLNGEKHDLDKYKLRREYWLRLSWSTRMYLTPFGSFDEFRDLYKVDKSVKCNELLSVMDKECFDILMKPEWIRVCLFRSYIEKFQHLNYMRRREIHMKRYREMNEMRSLVHIGCFNDDGMNIKRLKEEQLSFIMSDTLSRNESVHVFDALEREMKRQMCLEADLDDRCTNTTYMS